jgi:hypothetical protein
MHPDSITVVPSLRCLPVLRQRHDATLPVGIVAVSFPVILKVMSVG